MKPILSCGYFSGTPSKIMPVSWIIWATGCESVCTSMNLSNPSAPKYWGPRTVAWHATIEPSRSASA